MGSGDLMTLGTGTASCTWTAYFCLALKNLISRTHTHTHTYTHCLSFHIYIIETLHEIDDWKIVGMDMSNQSLLASKAL